MKVKGLVFFLTALLLLATPVMAVHTHGKGGYVSVETDGFDDGYYLVVWSNSSGVFGKLYHVMTNTPAGDPMKIANLTVGQKVWKTVIVSEKNEITQPNENRYLVVWAANVTEVSSSSGTFGIYAVIISHDGRDKSKILYLTNSSGNKYTANFGAGYWKNNKFIVAYRTRSGPVNYTIIDATDIDNPIVYGPYSLEIDYGWYLSKRIVKNNEYLALANRKNLILFKLNENGTLNMSRWISLSNNRNWESSIASIPGGFIIGFRYYYKWTLYKYTFSNDGVNTLGTFGTESYGGDMDFVVTNWDTRDGYVVFTYDDNAKIIIQKIYPDGSLGDNTTIEQENKSLKYPAIAAKPSHSPEAYVIAWSDTSNGEAEGSEYLPDFTEVSETNQVPFFSNLAIATATLLGILWLFRRK